MYLQLERPISGIKLSAPQAGCCRSRRCHLERTGQTNYSRTLDAGQEQVLIPKKATSFEQAVPALRTILDQKTVCIEIEPTAIACLQTPKKCASPHCRLGQDNWPFYSTTVGRCAHRQNSSIPTGGSGGRSGCSLVPDLSSREIYYEASLRLPHSTHQGISQTCVDHPFQIPLSQKIGKREPHQTSTVGQRLFQPQS